MSIAPFTSQDNVRDLLGRRAIKRVTFANTTGTVNLFTVTGDVIARVVAICKTNVASGAGANVEVGVSADTDAMIATTVATEIDQNEIWHDASPDATIEAMSVIKEFIISNGDDIIMTLSAQVDSGVIDFTCWWIPVSAGATVVAA